MDKRVFGEYYGTPTTPPEKPTAADNQTETAPHQPAQPAPPTRSTLRRLLLNGRRRRRTYP